MLSLRRLSRSPPSGARWVLLALMLSACGANEEVERRYAEHCAACHTTGASGAPKRGDRRAWAPLRHRGYEALLSSVLQGTPAMPAKGRCETCTEAQLKELIVLMAE